MFKIFRLHNAETEEYIVKKKISLIKITEDDLDGYRGYFENSFNKHEEASDFIKKYREDWTDYTILQIF